MYFLVLHGDAAIASQGICYELLQMSKLESYSTGGTIHFVINNQVGFTTDWNEEVISLLHFLGKDGRCSCYSC